MNRSERKMEAGKKHSMPRPSWSSVAVVALLGTTLSLQAAEQAEPALFASVALPQPRPILRFIVTGDAGGTHSRLREGMLRVQRERPIDAVLLVGDNFYPCGIGSVHDPQWSKITEHFGPLHVPIYPILGNHDYGNPVARRGQFVTCGSPDPQSELDEARIMPDWHFLARSYGLHSPLADIIMLDTQPIAGGWTEPYRGSATAAGVRAFLEQQLVASRGAWRIVVGHHTIYSSGSHGRQNSMFQRDMRALLPLLESSSVDLYICGHDHDLELIGDRTGQRRPLFLISGAGSGLDSLGRRPSSEPPTIFPDRLVPFYGFAVLEIAPSTLTITFYDEHGSARGRPFTLTRRVR